MSSPYVERCRHLVVVLGDQLTKDSAVFDDFDPERDAVVMFEVDEEASYVEQHRIRLVLFFAAMRHFRDELRDTGYTVHYVELDDRNNRGTLGEELKRWVNKARPERVRVAQPGDYRVRQSLQRSAHEADVTLDIVDDRHFVATPGDFADFAEGRKSLLMESFYRRMRRENDVLMDGDEPVGGQWNFDKDNRERFGGDGPGDIKAPRSFTPDAITRNVIALVRKRFPDAPGNVEAFDYPVRRDQARAALRDFVEHRLAKFGDYQDAMVAGRPYLYHSRLSCVLNLHLLDPREAIAAAVDAHDTGAAPINAVEGFVRQILGWREYVRGVYWSEMPEYAGMNALGAELEMPSFMWNADTDMACVRDGVENLVDHAYAHHIQRLMVLGLFSMLLGVKPYAVHEWHMSMYADAVDWVSLPNVLGMSQYGDGGIVGTKPYSASGKYIDKMGDYCKGCRFDVSKTVGEEACPFNTLYWDFLSRNRQRLSHNHRMGLQYRNLDRKSDSERRAIRQQADALKSSVT